MTIRARGFTLIELLVVIAIIGILAAVILASLNSARDKGGDAAVQANLNAIRSQAEIYYDGPGAQTYGASASDCVSGMFSIEPTIAKAIAAADKANGPGSVVCNSDGISYAVAAQLVASSTAWWCIDSASVGRAESGTIGGATTCP